jgi:hypothetical protein
VRSRRLALRLLLVLAMVLGVLAAVQPRPAGADPNQPPFYAQSVLNLPPSGTTGPRAIYAATSEQRTALAALESSARASIAADHGLTADDTPTMLGWARNEIRAQIFEDLLAIIEMPPDQRTADEQLDYQWVQAVVQRQAIDAALHAVAEYNLWSGNTSFTAQGVANPNQPISSSPDGKSGYCVYHAPDETPTSDPYPGRGDSTCFVPCQSVQGCDAPYPSYDTFLGWGNYDEDKTLIANPGVPQALPTTAVAVAGDIAKSALGLGAVGAGASIPAGTALAGTVVQNAILPYAAKSVLGAGEALGAAFAFIVAVVVVAAVITTIRSITITDDLNLPDKLNQLVNGARNDTNPDLPSIMSNGYGVQMLMAFVVGATSADPGPDPCNPDAYNCQESEPVPLPPSASDQKFDVKVNGQAQTSTTIDSRDWSNNAQTTRITGGWFVTAGTDPSTGASSTVQSLSWRYQDWSGKHWTARLVVGKDGHRHFLSDMLASDARAGTDAQPCNDTSTCFTSDSIQYLQPNGTQATVRLLGLPPTATDDEYAADTSLTSLRVPAPGVLANDSDPQGQTLTASIATQPAHGTLTLASDGSFNYTPDDGYGGRDTFTYTARNADGEDSAPATVLLTNTGPPPGVANDHYTTPQDTTLTVAAPGVQANDVAPVGQTILSRAITAPSHGVLKDAFSSGGASFGGLYSDGHFAYIPNAGFTGTDSFTYLDTSQAGRQSAPATVSIFIGTIAPAPPPPQITIYAPRDGDVVELGSIVTMHYVCTSPITILICQGPAPAGTPLDTFTPGAKTFTVTALDNNFQTSHTSVSYTVQDTTAPTVTIASPAEGASYTAGQQVSANYSCGDFALADCQGSIAPFADLDTATVGTKTFTVTGTDSSGNHTTKTAHYTVVPGAPSTVAASSGSDQSAPAGSTFANPLLARVTDKLGNTVPGYPVVFAVSSGSAHFGQHTSTTVLTGPDGVATSPALTAGSSAGPVVVSASSGPVSGTSAAVYLESVTAPGPAQADLSVTLAAPASAPAGGWITTTVTVRNAGPSPSGRYAAALLVPRGFTVTSASSGAIRYRALVIFTGSTLSSGHNITYTIVLKATTAPKGYTILGAGALAATRDPNYRNNLAVRTLKII